MEQHLVAIDGAELEVFISEDAAPVLVATHPSQYFGRDGGPLAVPLASLGKAVIVNPRGTGASSPWTSDDHPVRQLADDLDAIRRSLGLDRWSVVGQSLGGVVALVYALRHPSAVACLVLSCTTARGIADDRRSVYHPDHPDNALVREALDGGRPAAVRALVAHRKELVADDPGGGTSLVRHEAFVRELPRLRLPERLAEIAAPTLAVGGRHDRAIPPHHSEELATGIPGARLRIFEESGHFPYLEEPGAFHDTVAPFLAEHSGPNEPER